MQRRARKLVAAVVAASFLWAGAALAGGGVVLRNDTCIITIGFYEAHFTAYQPDTRGDEEFCEDLPDAAKSIFVLDYLHKSLREVPVDMRIIRNVSGKGEFARIEDVEALDNLEPHTVFYQPPLVRENGTFLVEHVFGEEGEYIGIVTAGHPSEDKTYTSLFPFAVGQAALPWGLIGFAAALLIAVFWLLAMKRIGRAGESA